MVPASAPFTLISLNGIGAVCHQFDLLSTDLHLIPCAGFVARLAKRREILIFPRTAGNTGNSRELLGNKSPSNQKILNYTIIT